MLRYFSKLAIAASALVLCASMDVTPVRAQGYDVWGAIAFNARGATGSAWNRSSRAQAERDALRICRENATTPCRVVSGANRACGAVAIGRRGTNRTAFGEIRPGLARARRAALDRCYDQGFDGCSVRAVMCADGSHR